MKKAFGPSYARAYDPIYQEKNYPAECDLIETLFHDFDRNRVSSVLDLGAGTGNHAFHLARRGYEVVGVERSKDMLAVAHAKLASASNLGHLVFREGDIRNFELGRQFDAALMMFAVLGYQVENSDVLSALRTTRRHLTPGRLFIFDVWYGPAVLHERPSQRIKVTPNAGGTLLRVASSDLDIPRHLCKVSYHVWSFGSESLLSETEETHVMRYFFPEELSLLLDTAGFELVRLGCFPEFKKDPDIDTWNVVGVARAI